MHFGRAAEKLGIGQPKLSRSIQKLEWYLRVKIINRTTRRLELTPAGQAYLDDARRLVGSIDLARHQAQQANTMGTISLRIGFIAAALAVLPKALRSFRKQWPQVEVLVEQRSSAELVQGLRDGSIDVALLSTLRQLDGVQIRSVRRCEFVALVPADWDIARKRKIRLIDLAHLPFVATPHDHDPIIRSAFTLACQEAGFEPRVVQESGQAYSVKALVAAGVGVSLQPEIYKALPLEGVVFVPITDLPKYLVWELSIAWIESHLPSAVLTDLIGKVVRQG